MRRNEASRRKARFDRVRLGIVAVSLIVSSTIILLIAINRGVQADVRLADIQFPDTLFDESSGSTSFHCLLITKRPMKTLVIAFYCLQSVRPIWTNLTPVSGRDEIATSILQIKNKIRICRALGLNYTVERGIPSTLGGKNCSMDLYDFSVLNRFEEYAGYSRTPLVAYGLVFNASDGRLLLFSEGVADFFWEKGKLLERLDIRIQENSTTYYPDEVIEMFGQYPSISDDSPPGRIVLHDPAKDTRVEVLMDIKGNPQEEGRPWGTVITMGMRVVCDGRTQERHFALKRSGNT